MVNVTQEEYHELLNKTGASKKVTGALSQVTSVKRESLIAKGCIPKPRMNKTESVYASMLAERARAGEILWWKFEPITLILREFDITEEVVRYTPDFMAMLANGELEITEAKGPHKWEDSWIKFKIAASLFPFRFVFAQRDKDWNWTRKELRH